MRFMEGLYIPRLDVKRMRGNVPPTDVAQILVDEYKCKNVAIPQNPLNIVELATHLAVLDSNDVGKLLIDERYTWHLEQWPLKALRITRIYPPQNDPNNLHQLVLDAKRKFEPFANMLARNRHIVDADIGFLPQPERDKLPIFCIRGKWSNHVIDGHHRSTRAVWDGRLSIGCLTAYRVD